jgi:hypothetical protein
MRKFAITAAAGLAMAAALPAQALLITFGGQNALDNSGLTSSLISNTNQMPAGSGFFRRDLRCGHLHGAAGCQHPG